MCYDVHYTGWAKKRGHSTFSQISSKLRKIIIQFLHHQGQCIVNMTTIFEFTHFTILKWRHLVNRLPLDNATLKLQDHGVGRHLAHRKDKRCVCGTEGQGQQSILVMWKFWPTVTAVVQGVAITSSRCSSLLLVKIRQMVPLYEIKLLNLVWIHMFIIHWPWCVQKIV